MSDIENNVTSEQNFCIISPVKDEVITEKRANSIARLLGKSEDNLKNEFYRFKVKQLMKMVGLHISRTKSQGEIEQELVLSEQAGVEDVLVTPFYFSLVKGLKKKTGKRFKVNVAVDFPLGEDALKGKIAGVKEACKKGADYVMCALPENSVKLSCFGEERRKIHKCFKASKKPFGIIAKAGGDDGELVRILKNTDGIKSDSIVIQGQSQDIYALKEAVDTAVLYKGKRKVFVLTDVSTVDHLSMLLDSKADKVFTPYANVLGQQLLGQSEIYS